MKVFYENGESCAAAVRPFRTIFGRKEAPNESKGRGLMKEFNEASSTVNSKNSFRSVDLPINGITIFEDQKIPTRFIKWKYIRSE